MLEKGDARLGVRNFFPGKFGMVIRSVRREGPFLFPVNPFLASFPVIKQRTGLIEGTEIDVMSELEVPLMCNVGEFWYRKRVYSISI